MSNPNNVALITQDPGTSAAPLLNLAGGGPSANRPSNPPPWFHYFDLDLGLDVVFNGSSWIVSRGGPQGPQGAQGPQGPGELSGPTNMRPSNPVDFQRFYDTDINCEIWWERGQWRTTAGTAGDTKFVLASSEAEAMTDNPGWVAVSTDYQGRALYFAGTAPTSGVTGRVTMSLFGEETHQLSTAELPTFNLSVGGGQGRAQADGNVGKADGILASANSGNTSSIGSNTPHNNIPAAVALICITKT